MWLWAGMGVASAGPSHWALSEPVVHGDAVDRGAAVTVEEVDLGETDGLVRLRACCGLEALGSCPDSSTYEIEWELDQEVDVLGRGDDVKITFSNTRVAGSCTDIDPIVVAAGDNGNPADSLPRLGVTFDGPVGIFDDTLAGGRFYTTNSDPHTDHDNDVRTLSLYDTDTMLDEGYFHIDVSQRWGLQYEIVWLYEKTDEPKGRRPGSTGCAHASFLPGAWAWLALAAGLRRARVGSVQDRRPPRV